MWPIHFELDPGETFGIETSKGLKVIRLLSFAEESEPDYWNLTKSSGATFARAYVDVEVSGIPVTLVLRPFQIPIVVNGVRIYVETTRNWEAHGELDSIDGLKKMVRFSALDAEEEWGPQNMVFPIAGYRWRASTFNNTWSALVPYNLVYYHRGEDFAAIPDRLDVLSALEGEVVVSPFEDQDEYGSNSVTILHPSGNLVLYGHMNIGSINPNLRKGTHVEAGETIGQVGRTWLGEETAQPHLHVSLHRSLNSQGYDHRNLDKYSIYPMLVSSYFRSYPDSILPVAGGYRFTTPGKEIELDGSLSLARPRRKISSYTWKLHDRSTIHESSTKVISERPGLYSEELVVKADDGAEDRDFAHVRVYDPSQERNIAYGDLYYFPNRKIAVNQPVLFWIQMENIQGQSTIDFGDGSPAQKIDSECTHAYSVPGIYTVTLSAVGPSNDPATIKTRIFIEHGAGNGRGNDCTSGYR